MVHQFARTQAPEMTTTMLGSSKAAAKENGGGGGVVNKGRIYVSESSPAMVLDAYRLQFQSDFSLFLSCRAEEVRQGGLLILTFVARRTKLPSAHDCYIWDLLADALVDMAAAGLVDEAKVDSFDAPFYGPCPEELRQVIHDEGSFALKRMDLFETSRRSSSSWDARSLAVETASTIRAVVEPMLGSHFGWDSVTMDGLFRRYRLLLDAYYRTNAGKLDDLTSVFIALEKR